MAVKEKLIQLVKGLKCPSKKIQDKLDAAVTLLKQANTKIPENQTGKQQVYNFLFLLFTSYPQTMTKQNYDKLEDFINQLEKSPAQRADRNRGR